MDGKKPSILITGANGQLGRCLQLFDVQFPDYNLVAMGREHLPLHDFALVDKVVESLHPAVVINAAAYTAVDKAEEEKDKANLINGYAVGNLAAAAKRVGATFLHVSTDYVFNGKASEPYTETDAVDPVNAYGQSKLLGEQLAFKENPQSIILRTSWVYSQYGSNFVKTMIRLMSSRESIGVVNDQTGCPTYAPDLAEALLLIATGTREKQPGIYHFSNAGIITWYDFAVAIKKIKGFSCAVNPITTGEFPTPARRPFYSVMNCNKIKTTFNIETKDWQSRLKECLHLL
ncbi:MAG: dTDP-4-dehydrorhamnose reductase [Chitinophagaceae bacterium]|jgi:dTDP-4-dehydrorhamnose reductase|nr:dTDP-4-dehydrorhamnose reductase [Chitinophagaceae bacterium]MCU0403108.1 dTDP-4-dehydrorhamnose reductase [Chitinophagaceae bacterium]